MASPLDAIYCAVLDGERLILVQEVAYTMGGGDSVATIIVNRDCAHLGCDRVGEGMACVAPQWSKSMVL